MTKKIYEKKNIFDLTDLSDLPEEYKEQLSVINFKKEESKNLFNLFLMKNKLKTDEIMVAYYRKYNKKVERRWVQATINNFIGARLIKRVERNEYKLIRDA